MKPLFNQSQSSDLQQQAFSRRNIMTQVMTSMFLVAAPVVKPQPAFADNFTPFGAIHKLSGPGQPDFQFLLDKYNNPSKGEQEEIRSYFNQILRADTYDQ